MKHIYSNQEAKALMSQNNIVWDEEKGVYLTKLHKDFYLRKDELTSFDVLKEFCSLIDFLKSHPEYGVSTNWSSSELNSYVYLNNKEELRLMFPSTIEALSRFYNDSSIIQFYESQGAKSPTVIDLVGTTGAGKTTFCQQFVDDESKELLKLTITDSAESTVIQTDILILENTTKKLFLRARSKSDIMKDLIMVALEIDLDLSANAVMDIMKKNTEIADQDTIEKVNNCYLTEELFCKYKLFAAKVQECHKSSDVTDKLKWIQENAGSQEFEYILDDLVSSINDSAYFYGYRQEYSLEDNAEYKVLTTIANTEFKYRKEEVEDYPELKDAVSIRLLFDHAVLVLPCSDEAKEKISYDFQQGMVLRDSQGHKLDEQNGIASDFEVKNKIFLIPIDTGGYLIDNRYSNIFERILISQPKNNVFILTKIDTNNAYKHYKKSNYVDDKKFKREFSEKITKTHNKLLNNFKSKQVEYSDGLDIVKDETILFKNFMTSFNNAYLSEIDDETYASDAHKLDYSGSALEDFDKSKLEIEYLESWFDIVGSIIKENKLTYHENITREKDVKKEEESKILDYSTGTMKTLVTFFISQQPWQKDIDEQLMVFDEDFRSIYQKGAVWYYSNFVTDGNTTNNTFYFKDLTAKVVRDISSYIVKDKGHNFVKTLLQDPLKEYLLSIYTSKKGNSDQILDSVSNKIIINSLERAAKIAYKVYDRHLSDNYHLTSIWDIYSDSKNRYIKPEKVKYGDVQKARRYYGTYTEHYAGIYCNLMAKYKYNLETYFLDIFKTILESELQELDKKVK